MSLSVFPNLTDDLDAVEQFSMKLFNPASLAIFGLSITNQTNEDFGDSVLSFLENPPPSLNGKYEGNVFNATINVTITMPSNEFGPIGVATLNSIDLLNYSVDCDGFSATKSGNSIQLTGKPINVFGQNFAFLMPDLTVKVLDPDTKENFVSLVKWSPPNIKVKTISHQFSVIINYTEDGTSRTSVVTLVMPQTIRWDFGLGVQSFQQVLAKSRRL